LLRDGSRAAFAWLRRRRNSLLPAEALNLSRDKPEAESMITRVCALLLVGLLGGCAGTGGSMTFTDDRGVSGQPFPTNYRTELLAFFRTYLTNPVGVRGAAMAEPVQRTVGGRLRYVSCVRFTPRQSNGSDGAPREVAVVHVDARVDSVMEDSQEACAGLAYAPFPELEKLSR